MPKHNVRGRRGLGDSVNCGLWSVWRESGRLRYLDITYALSTKPEAGRSCMVSSVFARVQLGYVVDQRLESGPRSAVARLRIHVGGANSLTVKHNSI